MNLKRYLFIIISILGLGITQAQNIPDGLMMDKTWTPTNDAGTEGYVSLEAFVTGQSVTTYTAIPTDIVLVVDQSGSMNEPFSGSTTSNERSKLRALKDAVTLFANIILEEAVTKGVDHKMAIVSFASSRYGNNSNWTNTELLSTQEVVPYASGYATSCQISPQQYQDALVSANINQQLNNRITLAIDRIDANGNTEMHYGMAMAKGVLDNRIDTEFTDESGTQHPRNQLVVFFTDGIPGTGSDFIQNVPENYWRHAQTTADETVAIANVLKTNDVGIYTIGIFDGADPNASYTTKKNIRSRRDTIRVENRICCRQRSHALHFQQL